MKRNAIIVVLIAAVVVYFFMHDCSDSLSGIWNGTLKFEQNQNVNLNLKKSESDGKLLATFNNPEMGLTNIPVDTIERDEQRVTFSLSSIGTKFEGILSNDGKNIDGNWIQGKNTFPLNLKGEKIIPGTIVGAWQGNLTVTQKLRLRLKVKKIEGKFQATIDSLDQGANDLPVEKIKRDKNQITFELKRLGARFVGNLDKKGDLINGNFSQSGTVLPLIFKKEIREQEQRNSE